MATDIYMPQLGLTMTEGTVVRWLKAEGDPVAKGEAVLEIETDKVVAEVEAPREGVLGPILVAEGAVAPVGSPLAYVLSGGEAPPREGVSGAKLPAADHERTISAHAERSDGVPRRGRMVASPRARRTAHELQVDLRQVEPSGPGGRIVEADVRWRADHLARRSPAAASPVAQRLAEELGVDIAAVEGTGRGGRITKEDVARTAATARPAAHPVEAVVEPLEGIRRVVAERMVHSFTTAPHFYLSVEADAAAMLRMRSGLIEKVEAATGARLTVTDILVKVCGHALSEFPQVNVAWAEHGGTGGVQHLTDANVGIAVALDEGLVVPVIRLADRLSLAEIAEQRTDLVSRARNGELKLQDLEGGTFTLSNLGVFGIDQFQAIINSPQSAILAVGRVRERPIVRDGSVVARPTVHLTLSVDHRLLDGAQAARFLERVSQLVEEPYLLLG